MNTITNLNTFPLGNSLDGVNIITEEINTLSLLVDGTNYMLSDLNMDNNNIINVSAGVDSLDAVNKSQLDTKADTSYVNTQLALKADKTYTDTQLALKADKTYVDSSLNLLRTYTNTQLTLKADKTYVDSSLNLLRTYTNTQLALKADKTYVDSSLNLLRIYTDSSLNLLRTYADTQLALKADKTYVDSSLNLLRSYVDTQDNLKVNKAGDTMTGALILNNVLNLNGGTFSGDSVVDNTNKSNTYIKFGEAGTATDWAYLRQIGGSNDIHLGLDFHDDSNDGKFSLRSINSSATPDATNTFFYASPAGVGIGTSTPTTKLDVNGDINFNNLFKISGFSGNPYTFLMSNGTSSPSWSGIGYEYKIVTYPATLSKSYNYPTNASNLVTVFSSLTFIVYPYHSATVNFLGGVVSQLISGGSGTDTATVYFRAVSTTTSDIYTSATSFYISNRGTTINKNVSDYNLIYIPRATSQRTFKIELYADIRTDDTYTITLQDGYIVANVQPTYNTQTLAMS